MAITTHKKRSTAKATSAGIVAPSGLLLDKNDPTRVVSYEFEVGDTPVKLVALELLVGDCIEVDEIFELPGCDNEKVYRPVSINCGACPLKLFNDGTVLVDRIWLGSSGRYRIRWIGGAPVTASVIKVEDCLATQDSIKESEDCACGVDLLCHLAAGVAFGGFANIDCLPEPFDPNPVDDNGDPFDDGIIIQPLV